MSVSQRVVNIPIKNLEVSVNLISNRVNGPKDQAFDFIALDIVGLEYCIVFEVEKNRQPNSTSEGS